MGREKRKKKYIFTYLFFPWKRGRKFFLLRKRGNDFYPPSLKGRRGII